MVKKQQHKFSTKIFTAVAKHDFILSVAMDFIQKIDFFIRIKIFIDVFKIFDDPILVKRLDSMN